MEIKAERRDDEDRWGTDAMRVLVDWLINAYPAYATKSDKAKLRSCKILKSKLQRCGRDSPHINASMIFAKIANLAKTGHPELAAVFKRVHGGQPSTDAARTLGRTKYLYWNKDAMDLLVRWMRGSLRRYHKLKRGDKGNMLVSLVKISQLRHTTRRVNRPYPRVFTLRPDLFRLFDQLSEIGRLGLGSHQLAATPTATWDSNASDIFFSWLMQYFTGFSPVTGRLAQSFQLCQLEKLLQRNGYASLIVDDILAKIAEVKTEYLIASSFPAVVNRYPELLELFQNEDTEDQNGDEGNTTGATDVASQKPSSRSSDTESEPDFEFQNVTEGRHPKRARIDNRIDIVPNGPNTDGEPTNDLLQRRVQFSMIRARLRKLDVPEQELDKVFPIPTGFANWANRSHSSNTDGEPTNDLLRRRVQFSMIRARLRKLDVPEQELDKVFPIPTGFENWANYYEGH